MKYAYQLLTRALLFLCFTPGLAAQVAYFATEIPGQGGDTCINSINNNKQAVGDTIAPGGLRKAFGWRFSDGSVKQLGSVPGYANTSLAFIDPAGNVYGAAWNTDADQQAYTYQNVDENWNGSWRAVSFPSPSVAVVANGVGSIGGYSRQLGRILPYIEQAGSVYQVPSPFAPNQDVWTTGLNDSNQYIGIGNSASPMAFKAVYDGSNWASQLLENSPWNSKTYAYSLNNSGDIAGTAFFDQTQYHAVVWSGSGAPPMDLGTLVGGIVSEGFSINALGTVVGYSTNSLGTPRAALFDGTNVFDVTPNPLLAAYGTTNNDSGQIGVCGQRTPGSPTSAWVLDPLTPPGQAARSRFLMHGFASIPEVMFVDK